MMVAEVKLVLDSKLATDTGKGEATSTTRTQCVPHTAALFLSPSSSVRLLTVLFRVWTHGHTACLRRRTRT